MNGTPNRAGLSCPGRSAPGRPSSERVQVVRGGDVRTSVVELLGGRDAEVGEPALAHVEVDGEDAVAAPVVDPRPQAAFAPGDGERAVLQIVGPDLADQRFHPAGAQRRPGRRRRRVRRPAGRWRRGAGVGATAPGGGVVWRDAVAWRRGGLAVAGGGRRRGRRGGGTGRDAQLVADVQRRVERGPLTASHSSTLAPDDAGKRFQKSLKRRCSVPEQAGCSDDRRHRPGGAAASAASRRVTTATGSGRDRGCRDRDARPCGGASGPSSSRDGAATELPAAVLAQGSATGIISTAAARWRRRAPDGDRRRRAHGGVLLDPWVDLVEGVERHRRRAACSTTWCVRLRRYGVRPSEAPRSDASRARTRWCRRSRP